MSEVKNDNKALERIKAEIEKIDRKESNVFFFVLDTKGNPNGSLEYIYKLALIVKEHGYNVSMLYQKEENEEFVGVGEWLGEKYSSLTHLDITSGEVSVSPSDLLFIPEIFYNVMNQTKKLPCKRVVILQNYDFILEQTPMSSQWGNVGIFECLTNTEINEKLIKEIFPYIKTTVVDPYIDGIYGETEEPKKMIVNIISKDQNNINKIIKPFYWKYPMYKWVSFRDVRGFPKETYSQMLREAAITIYVDDNTSFGYGALEALKSGSIVIAKTTDITQKWMENDGKLSDCCIWFDTFHEIHKIIANVVNAWISSNIPSEIKDSVKKALSNYSYENTENKMMKFIENILDNRKKEMSDLALTIKDGGKKDAE